jgi:putative ABC transport system permease protein
MDDIRFAWRRLIRHSAATLASILTLACAIAAVSATWSLLSTVLLRPVRAPGADDLMVLGAVGADQRSVHTAFTYPVAETLSSIGALADVALGGSGTTYAVANGEWQSRQGYFASANFFRVLRLPVQLGRDFTDADDRRGAVPVLILSDRFWRMALGGDPHVAGKTLFINDRNIEIVGVAAAGFHGVNVAEDIDFFGTLRAADQVLGSSNNLFADPNRRTSPSAWIGIMGRLKTGETSAAANSRLIAGAAAGGRYMLVPLQTAALPEASRPAMTQFTRLLSITVGLLLLVGCLTVGMLLLIRTEARRGEFATRVALGASRANLIGGVAAESALLSVAGAALSLPFTSWFMALLGSLKLPGAINVAALGLSIDRTVWLSSVSVSLVAMIAITLVAGVFGVSSRGSDAIARAGSTSRVTNHRLRSSLVAGQVAVTLVLVAGAGLFARSLREALHVNHGFDTTHLVTTQVGLWQYRYSPYEVAPFFVELASRLNANGAIDSAAMSSDLVGMGGQVVVNGIGKRFPSAVMTRAVDERYFPTVGLQVLTGRNFTRDDDSTAPWVTIVSASFAKLLDETGHPLDTRIRSFVGSGGVFPDISVVGVVPDVVTEISQLSPLVMYVPLGQQRDPGWRRGLILRPVGSMDVAIREAMATIRNVNPELKPAPMVMPLRTVDEQIALQMGPQRFGIAVLSALGGVALLLTLLGTYAIADSMATARQREMGVRTALGARRGQLAILILKDTLRLVGIGVVVGLSVAWLEANTIRAFLFRVQPLDPATLLSTTALIVVLAVAITLRPALAAGRVDLARLIREE